MEPLPESVHPGWPLPFVPQDWEHTPAAVQAYVHILQDELTQLRARMEALEARLKANSTRRVKISEGSVTKRFLCIFVQSTHEGIVKLRQKIARLCSKERTIEGFGRSRTPVFSLFPAPQLSSRGRRLRAIFH
jgi:hypothetical protein